MTQTTSQATPEQVNRFIATVDRFMRDVELLEAARDDVYASKNPALITEYETTLSRARALKSTIEATTGAWAKAKTLYREATATTSTWLGDAVDWLRTQWGYEPAGGIQGYMSGLRGLRGLRGLDAIQLPAAAWLLGITASAYVLSKAIQKILVSIEASKIQRENPTIRRESALARARETYQFGVFQFDKTPIIIAAIVAGYILLR